ncbi:MAG: hypothetical protein LBQ54_16635 [Planctomycetaceae bacterium]|nr:hypothetical protein [Planctomycetaceae bacterium]
MNYENPYEPPNDDFGEDLTGPPHPHDGWEYNEAREIWPVCPECGRRIEAACPFCKTSDDLFPLGDSTYWTDDLGESLVDYQREVDRKLAAKSVLFGEGDTSEPEHGHCHSCSGNGYGHDLDTEENGESWFTADDPPLVVICPTCAEAFVPAFPRKCRRCLAKENPDLFADSEETDDFAGSRFHEYDVPEEDSQEMFAGRNRSGCFTVMTGGLFLVTAAVLCYIWRG